MEEDEKDLAKQGTRRCVWEGKREKKKRTKASHRDEKQ